MSNMFCFLHIPRTAGTTLNEVLLQNFEGDEVISIYTKDEFEKYREISVERLDKVKLIQGHILLQNYNPFQMYSKDVSVFTFLRDPLARLKSEYFFLKTWKLSHMYDVIHSQALTFFDYVTSDLNSVKYKGKNFMTRVISGEDLSSSSARDRALSKAKKNLEKNFIFFGLQERFDESLVLLGKKLSLKNIFYEKRNVLAGRCKENLSDRDIEVAVEYNSLDIELYEFARELFDAIVTSELVVTRKEISAFQVLNAKYQKICGLINKKGGMQEGEILLPK